MGSSPTKLSRCQSPSVSPQVAPSALPTGAHCKLMTVRYSTTANKTWALCGYLIHTGELKVKPNWLYCHQRQRLPCPEDQTGRSTCPGRSEPAPWCGEVCLDVWPAVLTGGFPSHLVLVYSTWPLQQDIINRYLSKRYMAYRYLQLLT